MEAKQQILVFSPASFSRPCNPDTQGNRQVPAAIMRVTRSKEGSRAAALFFPQSKVCLLALLPVLTLQQRRPRGPSPATSSGPEVHHGKICRLGCRPTFLGSLGSSQGEEFLGPPPPADPGVHSSCTNPFNWQLSNPPRPPGKSHRGCLDYGF